MLSLLTMTSVVLSNSFNVVPVDNGQHRPFTKFQFCPIWQWPASSFKTVPTLSPLTIASIVFSNSPNVVPVDHGQYRPFKRFQRCFYRQWPASSFQTFKRCSCWRWPRIVLSNGSNVIPLTMASIVLPNSSKVALVDNGQHRPLKQFQR